MRLAEAAVVDSDWIAVDRWESAQPSYVRTLHVLASIEEEVNHALRKRAGGSAPPVQVFLLCGADMLSAMNDEKVWDRTLLRSLLSKYEIVCVGRTGVDTSEITREVGMPAVMLLLGELLTGWLHGSMLSALGVSDPC